MGRVHVQVTLRSFERADAEYAAGFLVDTGATDSMAPISELRRIGVVPFGRMAYELAGGSAHEYLFGLLASDFSRRSPRAECCSVRTARSRSSVSPRSSRSASPSTP
jgi:hypothetical protein